MEDQEVIDIVNRQNRNTAGKERSTLRQRFIHRKRATQIRIVAYVAVIALMIASQLGGTIAPAVAAVIGSVALFALGFDSGMHFRLLITPTKYRGKY